MSKNKQSKIIRSSCHSMIYLNHGKRQSLNLLLDLSRQTCEQIIEHVWNNPIEINGKTFDIANDILDAPKFLDSKLYANEILSARLVKCITGQALGMIRAATEKRRKQLFQIESLKTQGKDYEYIKLKPLVKPTVPIDFKLALDSICSDFELSEGDFVAFLCLKCLGKSFGQIKIPVKNNKVYQRWSKGKRLNSILISKSSFNLRFEHEPKESTGNIKLGIDQGVKKLLSFSNGVTSLEFTHPHGKTFEGVLDKMSRKTKGSKAFKRCQDERKNLINWTVNQIDLSDVKEIGLEEIKDMRRGKGTSRRLGHFTFPLIQQKLERYAEENGVHLNLQSSAYRSQRCSNCGMVRKDNRDGEDYSCISCGFVCDADINAAKNHVVDLPNLPYGVFGDLNKSGFLWNPGGIFSLDGRKLSVSGTRKTLS